MRLITAVLLGAGVLGEDQAPWIVLTVAIFIALMLVVMSTARSKPLAAVSAIAVGLTAGPVFPTSIGFVLKQYKGQEGVVFGAVFAILLIGGAVIPMGVGHVSKASSIRKGLLLVAGSAALLAVMSIILGIMPLPKT